MQNLYNREEARKVMEEQAVLKAGQLDRAVDHFYLTECGSSLSHLIPPGAYVYWWQRSEQMGGNPGDFWRSDEDVEYFLKRNPACRVKTKSRTIQSGWTPASETKTDDQPLIVLR